MGLFAGGWKLLIVVVVAVVVLSRSGLQRPTSKRQATPRAPIKVMPRALGNRVFIFLLVIAATAVAAWVVMRVSVAYWAHPLR